MKLFKKIGIWILSLLIAMVSLAYALFFLNQDVIKDEIILNVNRNIKGQISIEKIGLQLFSSFPQATINIQGVQLYEQKSDSTMEQELLYLNNINLSLNIDDLLHDTLSLEKLMIDGGSISLVSYADSTLNLLNAIAQTTSDTTIAQNNIILNLQDLEISNVQIAHYDEISRQYLSSTVNFIDSQIVIEQDSVKGNIHLGYHLDSLMSKDKLIMSDHSFLFNADFNANLDSLVFSVVPGRGKLDLLEFDLAGSYNYADSGYVDLNITANHDNLSELAGMELFNPEYLPDIKSGKLTLTTNIQGKTITTHPIINTIANLTELEVQNKFGPVIENSGFRLNFYSGTGDAMHDGMLYIDNVNLNFSSGGYLSGDLLVLDFSQPIYKINWQLEEDLVDLSKTFYFPGINNMAGIIRSQGRLKGNFDLLNKKFDNPQGMLRIQFDNCNLSLGNTNYELKDVNGQLFMNEGEVSIDNLSFNANGNQLVVNSKINNILPYLLGSRTELSTSLSLRTLSLNTSRLLAFDAKLEKSVDYKIDSIDLVLKGNFLSKDIDSFNLIPTGNLLINKLTAKVAGVPYINNIQADVQIKPDTLSINRLTGNIGKSPLKLDLQLTNYDCYFQTDSTEAMGLILNLESDELVAKDFFTIGDKFVLPKNYQQEVLTNVALSTNLTTTNNQLQKPKLFPEFNFQITGLRFQTHRSPVKFRDISIFGLVKDNNLYINSLFGKFGRSDVFMNAEFNNVLATKDTVSRSFRSRIGLNSQVLDLDELIKLGETESNMASTDANETASNPFADDYPVTDFSVNIGELTYYGSVVKNLSGILNLQDHNIIKLNKVKLESGDYGSFEFEGTFDASSHQEALLTSSIKISKVDLSKLNLTYTEDGKEVKLGDHLEGVFYGGINATVPILQDFSIDLNRLSGTINAVVMNGALVNYAPLQEMSKYFKNKNLNHVYFADLMNTMIFENGKMQLPYMTINTTLGTILLMGTITTDEEMELDVQVPVKLVAGAVLNSIFAANKGDDDKADVISTGPKGKYINLHIYGDSEEYFFKIGKKNRSVSKTGPTQ